MKKIVRILLLSIICFFMTDNLASLNVKAAEKNEISGIEISISSDKKEYSASDDVNISFAIKNISSDNLKSLNWDLKIPDGLTLKNGNLSGKNIKVIPIWRKGEDKRLKSFGFKRKSSVPHKLIGNNSKASIKFDLTVCHQLPPSLLNFEKSQEIFKILLTSGSFCALGRQKIFSKYLLTNSLFCALNPSGEIPEKVLTSTEFCDMGELLHLLYGKGVRIYPYSDEFLHRQTGHRCYLCRTPPRVCESRIPPDCTCCLHREVHSHRRIRAYLFSSYRI